MTTFIPFDDLEEGGQSAQYPKSITDMYSVREFIGRAGQIASEEIRVGHVTLKVGADYPAHSHPAPEVYVQIGGEVEWTVGSEACLVNTLTAINIPPNTKHAMRNIGQAVAELIYFWYAPGGQTDVLKTDAKLEAENNDS